MTLAYVFWHWPRGGTAVEAYEEKQRGFHRALRDSPPSGFSRSRSFAIGGAPWVSSNDAYEDWYDVADFCALGILNDAAVSAARRLPHDAAAALAGGGAGGVYRLRGELAVESPTFAIWSAKPEGMGYPELWSLLDAIAREEGASIWMRQMVLGPAPELCIQSSRPIALSGPLSGLGLSLRSVFP